MRHCCKRHRRPGHRDKRGRAQGEGVGASKGGGGGPEESHPRFLASKCLNSTMSHVCVCGLGRILLSEQGRSQKIKIVDTESLED